MQIKNSTEADLLESLLTRCGGHIIDMCSGGLDMIASGETAIHSGVHPVSFTESGLRLSNDKIVNADAVIWCTGASSHDGRLDLGNVLGAGGERLAKHIAPTWGVDAEGEVRGLFKRCGDGKEGHGSDTVWIVAGGGADHRWASKMIALQVKGVLTGDLPAPYMGDGS